MSLRQAALLMEGALRKELIILKRYYANTLGGLVLTFLFFVGMLFGGRAVAPGFMSSSTDALVVGYFYWTLATSAFEGTASAMTDEAQWGTLEQLLITSLGTRWVVISLTVSTLLSSFLFGVVTLVLILAVSGVTVSIDLLTVVPVLLVATLPAVGLGFLTGGLVLLFKRIGNLLQVGRFLFGGLIAVPLTVTGAELLPLTFSSHVIQRVMTQGVGITDLSMETVGVLLATSFGYLAVGYVGFYLLEQKAKQQGVLGHY